MQHVVATFESARLFYGNNVCRGLDDTNHTVFTSLIRTEPAYVRLTQISAQTAVADLLDRLSERMGECGCAFAIALEQMQGHALRSFRTDPGKHLKSSDQTINEWTNAHQRLAM